MFRNSGFIFISCVSILLQISNLLTSQISCVSILLPSTFFPAAVYAAEASDNHDLLEKVLPVTISHYVEYVKPHLAAGPNYRFVARQLLLLGGMLDYSDATNWRVASTFVHDLLHRNLDYEVDDTGNKIVIGDGINLGGDRDWACAVSTLAKKVHSAAGEFEEILLGVIEELAKPCRERTADFMQWMRTVLL